MTSKKVKKLTSKSAREIHPLYYETTTLIRACTLIEIAPATVKQSEAKGDVGRSLRRQADGAYRVIPVELAWEWDNRNTTRPNAKLASLPEGVEPVEPSRKTCRKSRTIEPEKRSNSNPKDKTDLSRKKMGEHLTQKAEYEAKLMQLKFEEAAGELVPVAEIKQHYFTLARAVRSKLVSIPTRLSAQLAAEEDPRVIHKRIDEEIRDALVELADDFKN